MSKLAIITGGSRGLGKSSALALADAGVDIVLTYHHNRDAAEAVVAEIKNKGQKAYALSLDTRDVAAFPSFINTLSRVLEEEFGRHEFDYLLNNAGTGIQAKIEETSYEGLEDMLAVHVKGPYFMTQALLPLIKNGGHILNVSSGLARFTLPGSSAYAIAKGGVEVMTRYMAKEFAARQIRVNTLAPGAIATDFRDGNVRDNPQMNNMVSSVTALGRVGEADDIGQAVAMLFSDGAGWITGQRIEASGGMFL
ncbi:SDR family NAD(P)-dependent oxidoreductase [Marinomonas pollencensis]|uniref:NAD(P)-dependent dehydrogenase (Short-subunit alcohol dehydrogenase family) n=1 Tax=Marinomonas pollencensis TaxID=491954 RepID=A0A3E0DKK2_9GAMM|nr:SDR family oxidoreductase [Marinomonas pollencensis]REG82602.1 NAD(P)-dependent dehydrogenase (short-subunit alcohol dehydrogenase family) [Marinomonas pollencensis]